ncbi:MAG: ABC transporter substrate-binding protein, partial [Candidatus Geothermarchaeales archaeon]
MVSDKKKVTIITVLIILIGLIFLALHPLLWKPAIVEKSTFPIFALDDFGRNVTLVKIPEKIVSTAPSNTEILFALGLGDEVVGVTKYCDYPPEVPERVEAGNLTVIGGYADPSIEKIVALNPDLVVAATNVQRKMIKTLEDKGFVVVALNPKNITQVILDISLIGRVTGKASVAESLANNMQQRISDIKNKMKDLTHRPRVYYEVWYDPLMTAGPGTWINELIEIAGGINIFGNANERYPQISSEAVIQLNPEIIIVNVGYHGGITKEDFEKRPGWSLIDAVKNDRIYEL